MNWNEKLQSLRKQKGLTQEELAAALYVSRTAISKWESGRGYPNIDSLKAIAAYFDVTVDELLSDGEWLSVAEEEAKGKEKRLCKTFFGMMDLFVGLLLFLPFFGQEVDGAMQVKRKFPEAVAIMLLPPSFAVQEARLRGRGTETEEKILERLAQTKREIPLLDRYDYIVRNPDGGAEQAAADLLAIVRAEQLRSMREPDASERYFTD